MFDDLFLIRDAVYRRVNAIEGEMAQTASQEKLLRLAGRLDEAREIYTLVDNAILELQAELDLYHRLTSLGLDYG